MTREDYDSIYRWVLRPRLWDWNAKEGYLKPIFGKQVTPVCVTLFLGVIAVRFRLWGGENLPNRVYAYYHPFIYKWHPYFDVDIRVSK